MPIPADGLPSYLTLALAVLSATVLAVPLFQRLGVGAVIGYLAAGAVLGPSGSAVFSDAEGVRHVAELGVVLLLFVVGLELEPARLLALRRDIMVLGPAQLLLTALAVASAGLAFGLKASAAITVGLALALSGTAIALQLLEERGETQAPVGRRTFAVLLFQDIAIIPILALVPILGANLSAQTDLAQASLTGALMVSAVLGVGLSGRYLINPLFKVLAATGAREVMTAGALMVVLGAAAAMQLAGLSMALGAFLAGVLLAESRYRHQLEADIEPFRGLLLGLFFMSVGMSVDLGALARNAVFLALAATALVLVKALVAGVLARATGSPTREAVRVGALLASAGEFSFVVFPLAASVGLIGRSDADLLIALAGTTMLIGPPVSIALQRILSRFESQRSLPEEDFSDATGNILVIGFGRFGQLLSQVLMTQGCELTIIDNDVDMIESARRFGFRVYYGDGTRLDVLKAAGAGRAEVICVVVNDRDAAARIVELVRVEFPLVRLHVRAYDRQHAIALMDRGVDLFVRETAESAFLFGRLTLEALGVDADTAASVEQDVRRRDSERLLVQQQQGIYAGSALMTKARVVQPEPLSEPRHPAEDLNPEAIAAAASPWPGRRPGEETGTQKPPAGSPT